MSANAEVDRVHLKWMRTALDRAYEAMRNKEVPVGCIMVYEGRILATGTNETNETKNATRHAEMVAIDEVLEWCKTESCEPNTVFNETTLYVTVEPCLMCTAALRIVGIRLVVYGCANDRFGGCGSVVSLHDNEQAYPGPALKCISGVYGPEAVKLLKEFYKGENEHAPIDKRKLKDSSMPESLEQS